MLYRTQLLFPAGMYGDRSCLWLPACLKRSRDINGLINGVRTDVLQIRGIHDRYYMERKIQKIWKKNRRKSLR